MSSFLEASIAQQQAWAASEQRRAAIRRAIERAATEEPSLAQRCVDSERFETELRRAYSEIEEEYEREHWVAAAWLALERMGAVRR